MSATQLMQGKKFGISVRNDEIFQRTDLFFDKYGNEFTVPNYDEEDERWQTDGLFIGEHSAKVVTRKEYNEIIEHYEDDFISWEDVCEELIFLDEDDISEDY